MLRVALVDILLFLTPFLIYAAYMLAIRGQSVEQLIKDIPVMWLIGAGFALLIIAMVALVSFSGGKPGGSYQPAVIENGVIKPAHID